MIRAPIPASPSTHNGDQSFLLLLACAGAPKGLLSPYLRPSAAVPLQITCDQRAGRLEPLSSRISTSLSSASPRARQTDLLSGLRRALDPASTAARLDPLDVLAPRLSSNAISAATRLQPVGFFCEEPILTPTRSISEWTQATPRTAGLTWSSRSCEPAEQRRTVSRPRAARWARPTARPSDSDRPGQRDGRSTSTVIFDLDS